MLLIEHLKDIDDSLYDHFERINYVGEGIKSLEKKVNHQYEKQNKNIKKSFSRLANKISKSNNKISLE